MTPIQHANKWLGWIASMSVATTVAMIVPPAFATVPDTNAASQPLTETAIAQNSATITSNQLAGQWHLKDFVPITLNIVFTPDGKMYLLLPSFFSSFSSRGNPFFGSATAYEFRYQLNANTSPMQLDLIVPLSNERVKTIAEVIDGNRLRVEYMGAAPGEPRPTEFTAGSIVLEKVSELTKLPQGTTITNIEAEQNKSREAEARSYVGSMARTQQAYFLENEKFSSSLEDLQVGLNPDTENYRYQVVPQGNTSERVLATAIPKRAGLRSYASTVFVVEIEGEKTTVVGICATEKPSKIPPAMPKLMETDSDSFEVECPAGSERY